MSLKLPLINPHASDRQLISQELLLDNYYAPSTRSENPLLLSSQSSKAFLSPKRATRLNIPSNSNELIGHTFSSHILQKEWDASPDTPSSLDGKKIKVRSAKLAPLNHHPKFEGDLSPTYDDFGTKESSNPLSGVIKARGSFNVGLSSQENDSLPHVNTLSKKKRGSIFGKQLDTSPGYDSDMHLNSKSGGLEGSSDGSQEPKSVKLKQEDEIVLTPKPKKEIKVVSKRRGTLVEAFHIKGLLSPEDTGNYSDTTWKKDDRTSEQQIQKKRASKLLHIVRKREAPKKQVDDSMESSEASLDSSQLGEEGIGTTRSDKVSRVSTPNELLSPDGGDEFFGRSLTSKKRSQFGAQAKDSQMKELFAAQKDISFRQQFLQKQIERMAGFPEGEEALKADDESELPQEVRTIKKKLALRSKKRDQRRESIKAGYQAESDTEKTANNKLNSEDTQEKKEKKPYLRGLLWFVVTLKISLEEKKEKLIVLRTSQAEEAQNILDTTRTVFKQHMLKFLQKDLLKIFTSKTPTWKFVSPKPMPAKKMDKECREFTESCKNIFLTLTQNVSALPDNFYELLANMASEGSVLPSNYFTEFELSKISFNRTGKTHQMTPLKRKFLISSVVLIRGLICSVLMQPWEILPVSKDTICKDKLLNIGSLLYNFGLDIFHELSSKKNSEEKIITQLFEIQPKKEPINCFHDSEDMVSFKIEEDKTRSHEIVKGFYSKKQLSCFFYERKEMSSEIKNAIEFWIDSVYEQANKHMKNPK